MIIKTEVYSRILEHPKDTPPETGGILGGINDMITEYVFDEGLPTERACRYVPDVDKLNRIISDWQAKGIDFKGMYHVHYFGVSTLSDNDRAYISEIMQAVSNSVTELYFPIVVMPRRKMVAYIASLKNGKLDIKEDSIQMV